MKDFDLAKRVKEIRTKKGLSQEQLADKSGLSVRTIQRIENGETAPRGDTLRQLAISLEVSQNDILDWKTEKDDNLLAILNLSQLSFIVFPLLGVIIPLAIWIHKKDRVEGVDKLGKSILNFQITWAISFFVLLFTFFQFIGLPVFLISLMYLFNIMMIIINIIKFSRTGETEYKPTYRFLQ
jgi:transcriptional regulator with XRE-family HTH domain